MLKMNGKRKQGQLKMTWRSRVEDRGSCRLNEMKRRCESNHGGDEVDSVTFVNKEKTRSKLDDDDEAQRWVLLLVTCFGVILRVHNTQYHENFIFCEVCFSMGITNCSQAQNRKKINTI